MRALLICLFSLVLSLTTWTAHATGLAWEISKDGQKSILLGSIHLGSSNFYPIDTRIIKAFDDSRILYVEMDDSKVSPQEQNRIMFEYAFYPGAETIYDHYSQGMINEMDKHLKMVGLDLKSLSKLRPTFIGTQVAVMQAQTLGYTLDKGVDVYFQNRAQGSKEIREIETFEQQIKMLAALPTDETTLSESFADLEDFQEMWEHIEKAWVNSNTDGLYEKFIGEAMKEFPTLKPSFKKLFFDRNVVMADTVKSCIAKREKCFVVVGAGHLVGPGGMLDLLEKAGYQTKQLKD